MAEGRAQLCVHPGMAVLWNQVLHMNCSRKGSLCPGCLKFEHMSRGIGPDPFTHSLGILPTKVASKLILGAKVAKTYVGEVTEYIFKQRKGNDRWLFAPALMEMLRKEQCDIFLKCNQRHIRISLLFRFSLRCQGRLEQKESNLISRSLWLSTEPCNPKT